MNDEEVLPVNSKPLPAAVFLPSSSVFLLTGKHAGKYLHARTTQDILGMKEGEARLAACLDGQGKLHALLNILVLEPGSRYLIVSEGGAPAEVERAILAYRVAEQASLELLADRRMVHVIVDSEGGAMLRRILDLLGQGVEHLLPIKRTDRVGYDVILGVEPYEALHSKLPPPIHRISEVEFSALRVLGQRPHFLLDIPAGRLIVETPLREAFTRKGCYPGQEVVEKVEAYGKAPRIVIACTVSGKIPEVGEIVYTEETVGKAGEVVSVGVLGERAYLFVRVKTDTANKPLMLESGEVLEPFL